MLVNADHMEYDREFSISEPYCTCSPRTQSNDHRIGRMMSKIEDNGSIYST